MKYAGFMQDGHGMTVLGRLVLDAWLFGVLPREQDCAGWDLGRLQGLIQQVQDKWDENGLFPGRLPADLRQRHEELYNWATERAKGLGWDPALGDDD